MADTDIDIATSLPAVVAEFDFDNASLDPSVELQAKFVFDGDSIIAAQLPQLLANFSVSDGKGINITATLPKLVANFVTTEGSVISGVLPRLLAAFALGHDSSMTIAGTITLHASMELFHENQIALEASLPAIRAAIELVTESNIDVSGVLPELTAAFSGEVDNDIVITATLPAVLAAMFIDVVEDCTYELRYER